MTQPTLVVLAAGMGSRYGGLKQIDPVGPSGEAIIDYSVFDALRAGFGKILFVIRRDIEKAFRETLGARFEKHADVAYAFQELDMLPEGFALPAGRTKPWGTAHAVLCAEKEVGEPFLVLNADDFYGLDAFERMAEFLNQTQGDDHAMAGYVLRNTLSEHGTVCRGVCHCDADRWLESVVEVTNIEKDGEGARYPNASGEMQALTGDEAVSMNYWGFTTSIFDRIREGFVEFLETRREEEKSELYIPTVVNELLEAGRARVKVLPSAGRWFGVTYQEDKPRVVEEIQTLVARGNYPESLWSS